MHQFRHIDGGFLVQEADTAEDPESEWKYVTQKRPTDEQLVELRFGWAMVRHVKSNAITLSKDRALVGVGAGQMSRVDSVEIAIRKAGERARGSVLCPGQMARLPGPNVRTSRSAVLIATSSSVRLPVAW